MNRYYSVHISFNHKNIKPFFRYTTAMKNETFSTYFNNWLYGTQGYYTNYKTIGKEGDFYTSVSTSSFFGGSIGKKIVDTIKSGRLKKDTTILEVGSHHGYLLADIIQFIYTLKPELLSTLTFAIVERFANLQAQQKKYLEDSFGDAINLKFYNDISEVKLPTAFVIANEIYDAFPCELVYTTKEGEFQQGFVNNHKVEFKTCEDKNLQEHCKKYKITKGEVGVGYEEFANHLCNNIKKFDFITFDYGEKYPRNDFSLRIYEQHNVHPFFEDDLQIEPLFAKSDITFDVHFDHIIESFQSAAQVEVNYMTQLKALVEFGIIELLEMLKEHADENSYLRETQKVKTLLEPTGMGDRFKMLHIQK